MPNYKNRAWQRLFTTKTTGALGTIDISIPSTDFDKYSEIIIFIDATATAALELRMALNTVVTNYYHSGTSIDGGTETLESGGAIAYWPIATTAIFSGASEPATIEIHIKIGGLRTNITWLASGSNTIEMQSGLQTADLDPVTSIEIDTSTSTLATGARVTVYRVSR